MQREIELQSDLDDGAADGDAVLEPKKNSRRLYWVHGIAFVFGLSLLVFVIQRIGYQTVLDSVSRVGLGFFVIIGLNITRHFMRAASMYLAVAPEHRSFKYRSAVAARFGGDAVNLFSVMGPFLGDATKAMLLRKNLPLTHGASAVIIDNILYYFTVIMVILGGVVTLLVTFGSSGSTMNRVLLVIVTGALIIFTGLILSMLYSISPISHVIGLLDRREIAPRFLLKRRESIRNVESNVFRFYHDRKTDFFKVFGVSLLVHVVSVTEVFAALTFLDETASVSTAFIIESLTKVINAAFGFIPGTIGAYEGGQGIILKTLGYTTATGLALALVRRGAILVSTGIGLSILLWRGAQGGARRLSKKD